MAEGTDYIDHQISYSSASASLPNFGALLVVAHSAAAAPGLHVMTPSGEGLDALVTATGLLTNDSAYKLLAGTVAPNTHTTDIAWYNSKNPLTASQVLLTVKGVVRPGRELKIGVQGTVYTSGPMQEGDSMQDALDALIADISTGADLTAVSTVSGSEFSITEDSDEPLYLSKYSTNDWEVVDNSAPTADALDSYSDAKAAASDAEYDFYGVLFDVGNDQDIDELQGAVEVDKKLALFKTRNHTSFEGQGAVDNSHSKGFHRSSVFCSLDDAARADARLLSQELGKDPGQSDFQFKGLAGLAYDRLAPGQVGSIRDKNGIAYTSTMGVSMTDGGKAGSGRPMVVTRNLDYMHARMQAAVINLFAGNDIVPLNATGIAMIEAKLTVVLENMLTRTILDTYALTVPTEADITDEMRDEGEFPQFDYTGVTTVAGRKVIVRGKLI